MGCASSSQSGLRPRCGPPGASWQLALVLFCGVSLMQLSGCVAPEISRRVSEEAHQAAEAQAALRYPQAPASSNHPPETLDELLLRVIQADHQYRIAASDIKLAEVQLSDARSQLLPRLFAEGQLQVPINSNGVDTFLNGGLYLRFDLMRALFRKNAITVAEVTAEAKKEKCRAAAAGSCHVLFSRLTRLEAGLRALEHNRAQRTLATQAAAEADNLFKTGRADADASHTWQRRRQEAEFRQPRLASSVERLHLELTQACGIEVPDATLVDFLDRFVEKIETASRQDIPGGLTQVLERSPAVTSAKLDLFLAEVSIAEARLQRLPRVYFSLAAGNVPVEGNVFHTEEGVVPMVGASLPLLDMGDISRAVKKARLHAEQAREQMLQAIENARIDIESSGRDLEAARTAEVATQRLRDEAATRRGEIQALYEAGNASALTAHEASWQFLEAEAAVDEARQEYHLALLQERAAKSTLLLPEFEQELRSQQALSR